MPWTLRASDSFTRADEIPLFGAGVWTATTLGAVNLVGNLVGPPANLAHYASRHTVVLKNRQYVAFNVLAVANINYDWVLLRGSEAGGLNGYTFQHDNASATTGYITKFVAGVQTTLRTVTGGPSRVTFPLRRFSAALSTLTLEYWNGAAWVVYETWSDWSFASGFAGVGSFRTAGAANSITSWEAGDDDPLAVPSGTLITDTFRRGDGFFDLTTSPWLDLAGGDPACRIFNGRLGNTPPSGNGSYGYYDNSFGVAGDDQWAEMDCFHDGFSNFFGVILRYDPSARKGYVFAVNNVGGCDAFRYNSGVNSGMTGGHAAWPNPTGVHRMRFEIRGNPNPEMKYYRDGVLLGTCFDDTGFAPYQSGFIGVYAAGGSGGVISGANNFAGGNLFGPSTDGGRRRKHGGEFWGIVPEIANYIG
jgi:hypothetical protein